MDNDYFDAMFSGTPMMAILRGLGPDRSVAVAHKAWDLGIRSVEIPVQRPADLEALRAVVAAGRTRGQDVGAGTIISAGQLARVVEAGARFAVSPGTDPAVMAACREAGLPQLPGVATPSDLQTVIGAGGLWAKAFPASVLGADWIKAMAGPFPDINLVATGGIDAGNAEAFLAAGARVVAVGSALEDPNQLERLGRVLGAHVDKRQAALKDSSNAE